MSITSRQWQATAAELKNAELKAALIEAFNRLIYAIENPDLAAHDYNDFILKTKPHQLEALKDYLEALKTCKREFRISSMLFLSCQHDFSWHPVPY